jgi:hypothetical protein
MIAGRRCEKPDLLVQTAGGVVRDVGEMAPRSRVSSEAH